MINSNINIDIKSIPAFESINDSSLLKIESEAEILNFNIGQRLSLLDTIPDKVLIILSGKARFLHLNKSSLRRETSTITTLKADDFIGISSILTGKGCEFVTASTELLALSISDNLIVNLYKEDSSFKNWCNTKVQVADAYELALNIKEKSPRSKKSIKDLVEILINNTAIKSLNDGEQLPINEQFISVIGSNNMIDKKLFEIINSKQKVNIRGPLAGRIYQIQKSLYDSLINENIKDEESDNDNSLSLRSSKEDKNKELVVKQAPENISKSLEYLGEYDPKNKFKIIRANGLLREAIACLQMITTELKIPYRVDAVEKILRDTISRGKKPTIQILGGLTSMMGLHSGAAKINPKNWTRLPTPSIISWKNSFAVVIESNTKFIELASPSEGLIHIEAEEISENFNDDFIEILMVDKHEQTPEIKFGIQWLLPAIKRYRGVLSQVLLASFMVQLFGLANPLMIQVIIDKVISQRSLDTLQVLGIALVFVTIIGGILSSLRTFLFAETTNRIDTRLGAEVIDHLLRLPLKYFDNRPVGELGSRIAELEKIRNFLTGQALTTILDAAFSLIYIIVMVIYSWLLTLIALGVVPIQILITIIGTPLIRRQIREIAKENASTQSHLIEVLTGIQNVKAQNVERVSRWKWQELYSKYISRSFEKTITGTSLGETSQVLQQLSQLLVLWVGASLVLNGELSLGQLIAFRIISGYVTQPLLRLSTIWQNVQELRVSFERLADIVDTPEEANELDKAKIPLPSIKGSVEFEDLSFKFDISQQEILKTINLKINPGQFVGIVGQSGSGKSTLMKLLPRLYNPSSGKILIDGYDINKVELYSLRRQIGIVPQEPLLFAGSVSENIALTDPDSSSDEIVKAAKIANAHDFIMGLPDGYSTNVGERGSGLSGGQKQRIAIARTLLSNPKLLIMDEATSALDYETENKVCQGLKASCKNSTVFFITHRLSTVKNADLIVMLHQGSIVETGTHSELMELRGRYFALYRQQDGI